MDGVAFLIMAWYRAVLDTYEPRVVVDVIVYATGLWIVWYALLIYTPVGRRFRKNF